MLENKKEIIEALEKLEESGFGDYALLTADGDNVPFSLRTIVRVANYFTALSAIRKEMAECHHPTYEDSSIIHGARVYVPEYEIDGYGDDEGFICYENLDKIDDYYRKVMNVKGEKEEYSTDNAEYDILTDQYYMIDRRSTFQTLFIPIDIDNNIIYLDKGIEVDMNDEKSEAIVRDYINTFDYDKDTNHKAPIIPMGDYSPNR